MARYSPRDPGFTPVPTLGDALASLARSGGEAQRTIEEREDLERQRDELERRRGVEEEDREVELFESGFTREPRRETIPEEEDVFADALPGLETADPRRRPPDVFEGAGIGMQPDETPAAGALGQLEQTGEIPAEQPEILAVPGSFVEGMGFTPNAIRSDDFVEARRQSMSRARTRMAPGVEQVTENLFFDESRTPGARQEARDTERDSARRARLEAVLGAVGEGDDVPPEVLAEGLELGVPSRMLEGGGRDEPGTIRVSGRDFPNTPTGEAAALAWREAVAEAGRTSGGGRTGSAERITGEVTRRTLATAAARAMDKIRSDVRDLTPFERRNLEPGQIETQIRETLELFGFDSPAELQEEMRELRLAGTGGQGQTTGFDEGAGGGGGGEIEVPADLVDQVMEEFPNATQEELTDIVIQRMQGGGS